MGAINGILMEVFISAIVRRATVLKSYYPNKHQYACFLINIMVTVNEFSEIIHNYCAKKGMRINT